LGDDEEEVRRSLAKDAFASLRLGDDEEEGSLKMPWLTRSLTRSVAKDALVADSGNVGR